VTHWRLPARATALTALLASAVAHAAVPAENAPQSATADFATTEGDAAASPPTPPDTLEAALGSAKAHFAAGEFEQAARGFEAALALATDDRSRAVIAFNAAVVWFQAERYELARRWFLRSAMLDPEEADAAYLHAGFSALRLGDWRHAEQLLALSGDAAPLDDMRTRLATELFAAKRDAQRAEQDAQLTRAVTAIRNAQWLLARRLLDSFLTLTDSDASSRAEAHHGLALIDIAEENLAGAHQQLLEAAAQTPTDAQMLLTLAETAERATLDDDAIVLYQRSLEAGLTGEEAERAKSRRLTLVAAQDQLSLYGRFGAGIDSNADQSGTNSTVGTGNSATMASPFISLYAEARRRARLSSNNWVEAGLGLDSITLLADSTRELSLHRHDQYVALDIGVAKRLRLVPRLVATWYLAGFEQAEPFLAEGGAQLRLTYDHSARSQSSAEVEARALRGFGDYSYLDGLQLTASATQRWRTKRWRVEAALTGRLYDVGTLETPLTAASLPRCGPFCEGGTYVIPLGYGAVAGRLRESWSPWTQLYLGAQQSVEGRHYLHDSYILGGPFSQLELTGSRKRRGDLRLQLGADATWAFTAQGNSGLTLQYSLLLSDSNIAYDARSIRHRLDYSNRSFTQHLIELGVFLSY
jgi:Flp pilus assembly protein TadD